MEAADFTMDFGHHTLFPTDTATMPKHFSGLHGSALAYALARFWFQTQKTLLVVLPTPKELMELQEQLEFFMGPQAPVMAFPPLGIYPYYGLRPGVEVIAQRLSFLDALKHRRDPWIGLISVTALMRRLPPKSFLDEHSEYLVVGEEISRDRLLESLVQSGYQDAPLVEDPGTFSKRGGIIDLFSPQWENPIRLEFFGDQLESLRTFDPQNQRSLKTLDDAMVLPAHEIIFTDDSLAKAKHRFRELANEYGVEKESRDAFLEALKHRMQPPALETFLPLFYSELKTLIDYLPKDFYGVWLEPESCSKVCKDQWQHLQLAHDSCQSVESVIDPEKLVLTWSQIETGLQEKFHLVGRELGSGDEDLTFKTEGHEALTVQLKHAPLGEGMLQPLMDQLRKWGEGGNRVALVASTHAQGLRLKDLLERHQFPLHTLERGFAKLPSVKDAPTRQIYLLEGHLAKGFYWPEERLILITDQEIFGEKRRQRRRTSIPTEAFTTFEELAEGDYVVHEEHGLGIYRGLHALEVGEQSGDFLLLEYLGGDRLYLPVYRLNQVSRYQAGEGHAPRLDKMGGSAWEKSKSKVRSELKAMAGELLKLYAERATLKGHGFASGGELYEEFEATFPFEETPDQDKAIVQVNQDMDSDRPMDRLVCGDVGFGKTEVAMRAAFRALLENKQIAILVPTTVLALQHERNFRARFQQYPAMISTLSRFSTAKEQRETLEKLKAGKVDIIIGTHALLSKRVEFKDLGLLVVDEEHRFGVAQKEKIKLMRKQADVLTLTATPIPRTLNMSLSGIRDLSVIATPPVDRMAIQTFVATYNEALIKEAVMRELARGGQVYFIHNRVQSIGKFKRRLMELVPEAKIEVGHGQMNEKELEEVMIRFLNREFNVFLCTTIVESGLDVPSANTMIVNRADTLGLAQLYQLRGRIGRSNIRAFAYLLTPGNQLMTRKAQMRLGVLQRYSDLGSGFKIAAHDLEIRGSGNLLGAEQSGHIAAMGYELYLRLLEEAVAEVKGEELRQAPEPELQLRLAAQIPESYMPETQMRLTLYKRFASVQDEEELEALGEETQDRFGGLPFELLNLMTLMRVKIWAKRAWLRALIQEPNRIVFRFDPEAPIQIEALMARIAKEPERFRWLKPHELSMAFKPGKEDKALEGAIQFLTTIELISETEKAH